MNQRFTPLAAALLTAFSVPFVMPVAYSQTTPADTTLPEIKVESNDAIYNAPTASTATKINAPLRDIPQTVNVITQAVMRDKGVRSMEDAVKSVPGVSLVHGDGQRDQVFTVSYTHLTLPTSDLV